VLAGWLRRTFSTTLMLLKAIAALAMNLPAGNVDLRSFFLTLQQGESSQSTR